MLFDLHGHYDRNPRCIKIETKFQQAMKRFLPGGRSPLFQILTKQGVTQTLPPVGFPHLYGLADQQFGGEHRQFSIAAYRRGIAADAYHHHHAIVIDNRMINTRMHVVKTRGFRGVVNTNAFPGAYYLPGDFMLFADTMPFT